MPLGSGDTPRCAGSFSNARGAVKCDLCPQAQYQDRPAQAACRTCPEHSMPQSPLDDKLVASPVLGATSVLNCSCTQGYFIALDNPSCATYEAECCGVCPRGGLCPGSTDRQGVPGQPIARAGFYMLLTGKSRLFVECSPPEVRAARLRALPL
jgi:hypothetical protein